MGHHSSASIRVFHVDDEPDFADMAATFLERADDRITVETATSAREALDRLAPGDFDCIVSDYQMPGMNGIELLKAVREEYPDLPFILFTGKGGEEVASDAISAGVTDYLQKGSGSSQYELLATRIKNAIEKHRARAAVTETENRLRTIAEHTNDILWEFTDNWSELLFINSPYEEIWGRSIAELRKEPQSFLKGIHPDDRSRVKAAMEQLSAGESVDIEYRVNADEGFERWVWTQARPIFDDSGEVKKIAGFVRDITERKEREQRRETERQQLRTIAENLPNGAVSLFNTDLQYTIVGGEAFDHHGLSTEELEGKRLDEVHTPEFQDRHLPKYRAALDGERTAFKFEFEGRVYQGRTIPVRDSSGEVIAGMAMTQDITDRVEAERDLKRQNERLEEFASIVSHDLRNPLNVAGGYLELARTECDSDELDNVAQALNRMETLIDNLLALAREGEGANGIEPVDIANAFERGWRNVETAEATAVTETERTIQADPSRLQQLLENLIRNAVDHGGEGVTITVGDLDDGFYVADDGPGIPADERERVFENGYSTTDGGIGFGLSIVDEIADAYGWEVHVTESEDGGAQFEFTGVEFAPW